jgi:6-pyruvoyltetrahydropterin/6-carboxytetrahydropterin synthase
MKTRLSRTFTFDAAHNLVEYEGVCSRIHGHTYTLVVTVEGDPDPKGMLIDFFELKTLVNDSILSNLDHTYLNDFYTQPTVEHIAADIFHILQKKLKEIHPSLRLYSVRLWEGGKSYVEVFA